MNAEVRLNEGRQSIWFQRCCDTKYWRHHLESELDRKQMKHGALRGLDLDRDHPLSCSAIFRPGPSSESGDSTCHGRKPESHGNNRNS